MHIISESHFHGLRGSSGLQMTSEVKAYLRIELSDLNYPGIHMHVASVGHIGGLWGHGSLQMTSEDTSEVRFELSDLNYLCSHASLACKCFPEMIATNRANYDP